MMLSTLLGDILHKEGKVTFHLLACLVLYFQGTR